MADRMGNIAGLFKEGRTRIIVLTTLVILGVAIVVGIMSVRGRVAGGEVGAGVSRAPGNIESVPFESPNEEYAKLQEAQNTQVAEKAKEAGTAAIPTIIRAGDDQGDVPANADYGVGFTALSREQSDAGTFTAKTFGETQTKCAVYAGAPVYDAQGRLIGYVGPDGKVRGLNGEIIGSVDPDGTVRDLNGKIIGKVGTKSSNGTEGTPVYDNNGNLIGYVGPDGKVRDLKGNIIGTVGPDGLVRDANGNIIGRAGSVIAGTPVYDENGNLIGYVGADGKVRDASGKIIGEVGPDGLVRDLSGKVIGRVGTPVYDANGNLIGFAGPDGKVRDKDGNIIGTVGPDGVVRDLNGKIIGKAGAITPGTPIYDANGNIIGYVGPDGKVRDANGNVIGTIGVDGNVTDANGNIIGSIRKPIVQVSPVVSTDQQAPQELDEAAAAALRQQQLLQDQRYQQQLQQRQQGMQQQINQLLGAWISPTQQFVAGQTDENAQGQSSGSSAASGSASSGTIGATSVFIKAGTIYYGIINTSLNSDEPGPIMASIINGPYKGGTLIGTITNQGTAVMLTFNTLTLDSFPQSIAVNAVAIDQNTARTALSTYTDNHYMLRYGSLFAASFLQGYGQAFSQSGSTTATNGLTTVSSTPDLSPQGKFFVALGNVGNSFSAQVNTLFNTPPTVYVASGTAVGILFLGDVQLPGMGGAAATPPALPGQTSTASSSTVTTPPKTSVSPASLATGSLQGIG
jgi:type IV secretory pathway VirB10-like protein